MKIPANITNEKLKQCVTFHGHLCPGLALGYMAAMEGMKQLGVKRAFDEEIVSIVETDACCADAVQVLTGCTLGKGNYFFKDYGKTAMTFFSRDSGKGVRIALKPGALDLSKRHRELFNSNMSNEITEEERAEFWGMHHQVSYDILEKNFNDVFTLKTIERAIPGKAVIEPSLICDQCGEPVMGTKLKSINGQKICGGCQEENSVT